MYNHRLVNKIFQMVLGGTDAEKLVSIEKLKEQFDAEKIDVSEIEVCHNYTAKMSSMLRQVRELNQIISDQNKYDADFLVRHKRIIDTFHKNLKRFDDVFLVYCEKFPTIPAHKRAKDFCEKVGITVGNFHNYQRGISYIPDEYAKKIWEM